jgi:hypothetical protein
LKNCWGDIAIFLALANQVFDARPDLYGRNSIQATVNTEKQVTEILMNGVIGDSAQPLPVILEALTDFGDVTIFTILDLLICYWKIFLSDRVKKCTAFVTYDGGQYAF